MEIELLEDIRTLLIRNRVGEIRLNIERAESEADIEEVHLNGESHKVLTRPAAFRIAVSELKQDKAFIRSLVG